MSADESMKSLAAEARTTLEVIRKIEDYYDEYTRSSLHREKPSRESRIVLAERFGNYYTALEAFFLRVSQTFENNLTISSLTTTGTSWSFWRRSSLLFAIRSTAI